MFKNSVFFYSLFLGAVSFSETSFSLNSNFVLISTYHNPSFVAEKSLETYEEIRLEKDLIKTDAQCERVFSFYPTSHTAPKVVTRKKDMVFLFTDKKKFEPLGTWIPQQNEELLRMENSVADGKLLVGFKNKAHESVALIEDNRGKIYAVTRLSKQHYVIQTFGVLTNG